MAFSHQDVTFMRRALALAEAGRGRVEPNPMVGAVIVRDGQAVGEGHYRRFGGPHAEVHALRQAGEAAKGAVLYVTLEPCDHQGKTPACAPAVAAARPARVVAAALDPTAHEPGGGMAQLRSAGIRVDVGVCREEAVRLNAGFYKLAAVRRPLVIAKWAMSADGKLATVTGDSKWVTSAESRRLVHETRGWVDCIMVGAGTAAADDPLLTCRNAEARRTAARLVVCGSRAPRADSRLMQTLGHAPVIIAHPSGREPDGLGALVAAGCEALPVPAQACRPDRLDLGRLLDALGERRMTNVLVEGGGVLFGELFDAGLVDRVMAFMAPVVLGGAASVTPVGGRGTPTVADAPMLIDPQTISVGSDVLMQGWLADPMNWAP